MTRVFVYGSLLSGLQNHRLLQREEARLIGDGTAQGEFTMCDFGGFPGAYEEDGGEPIPGELYAVDDNGLEALDRLESEGRFYQRVDVQVELQDGSAMEAQMYTLIRRRDDLLRVPGNDWRSHVSKPEAVR